MFKLLKNVTLREFKYFLHSPSLLLICVGAPLLFVLMFSTLYYNKRASNISVGVVNMDNSSESRRLIRYFNASPELNVTSRPLSGYEAYNEILSGKLGAFYFIPKNFSADLKKGKNTFAFGAADAGSFIIPSNALKKFSGISMSFSQKQFTKELVDKGYSYKAAKAAFEPLRSDVRYLFNTKMNYSDFLIPGLFFAVLQQILLISICTAIATDDRKNLFKISGGKFCVMFLGKIIPYAASAALLAAAFAFIAFPENGIVMDSALGYFMLSLAFVIAVSSFGFFISSFFKTQETAMTVLMFYSMPAVLLSGFVWPWNALPTVLKVLSYILPSTYVLTEIRLFVLGSISAKYALIPSATLLVFACACYILSFLLYKNKSYFGAIR
jgi:ABC-2 type transport system permease protein